MTKSTKPQAAGPKEEGQRELGLFSLTALVIGSIIGSGVFNMMTNMSQSAGLIGIILGWVVTAIGMTFLVFTFRNLNKKKPKLDAGIYSYASDGFGKFLGFSSAWGYWISAWVGNVAYATLAFGALGYFLPDVFAGGENIPSIIGASVVLWGGQYLIMRGVKSASFLNAVVTVAKLLPIAIFILALFIGFKLDIFTTDIWSTGDMGNLFEQMKGTMLTTVWAFIGIEGAVIFSGRAKNRADVGRASFLGLYLVIAVYVLVSVLSLGIMTRPELANLAQPGMAGVLEHIVGSWGAVLINAGVIISVLGAWLAWTLFAVELPYRAAKDGTFPAIFAKTNKNGTPVVALWTTNILIQAFLFTFLINWGENGNTAYNSAYSLSTTTILVPYMLTALYQLKISLAEKVGTKGRGFNILVGVVASVYGGWLIYAAGMDYLLLTTVIYAVGVVVYVINRIMIRKKPLTSVESIIATLLIVGAVYAIQQIAAGNIQL